MNLPHKTEILGIPVEVVNDEESEKCDWRLCSLSQYFPDDVISKCSVCNRTVYLRPYPPYKPPKICIACAEMAFSVETND